MTDATAGSPAAPKQSRHSGSLFEWNGWNMNKI